jgi:hypothetical protein
MERPKIPDNQMTAKGASVSGQLPRGVGGAQATGIRRNAAGEDRSSIRANETDKKGTEELQSVEDFRLEDRAAARRDFELSVSRIGALKRRLLSLSFNKIDFSGLPVDAEAFGIRVVLRRPEDSAQFSVGRAQISETLVMLSVTAKQFVNLYYFLNFYRENPIEFEEVRLSAMRVLDEAGVAEGPILLEASLYRKMPGIVRRVGSGVCLFEAESAIEAHDVARLFFHEESFPFIMMGSIALFFSEPGALALEDLLLLKYALLTKFAKRHHSRFILFGSVVLYALGMRLPNMFDLLVDDKGAGQAFSSTIERFLVQHSRSRVEVYYRGLGAWTAERLEPYDRWFREEWPRLLGVETLQELFCSPGRHAYFMGLRVTTLRDDIRRRSCRISPAACADLVALKRVPGLAQYYPFEIPEFPDSYWANYREYAMAAIDRAKFVRTINAYLRERYTFTLPEPTLWSLFSG